MIRAGQSPGGFAECPMVCTLRNMVVRYFDGNPGAFSKSFSIVMILVWMVWNSVLENASLKTEIHSQKLKTGWTFGCLSKSITFAPEIIRRGISQSG